MGTEFLVEEQIDAGENFVRDFNGYVPISVAFWVVAADSNDLILYIASDQIDGNNFDVAYGEVLRKLSPMRNLWLDPFQIKLVNSSDPMAKAAIEIRDRYPASTIPTHYGGKSLGGTSIEGAYIYPQICSLKAMP